MASPTVPEGDFQAACDRAGVAAGARAALWRLHREWPSPGDAGERLAALLADLGHWRLFQLSREGDAAAARRFEAHWREVARSFLGRGFTREQVEEFTSLFFVRVYRHAPGFAWATPFTAYLRTILLNIARDHLRRLRRSRAREVPLAEPDGARADGPPDPAPSAEEAVLAGEKRAAVRRALDQLGPLDRQVLVQHVVLGRSGEEIAQRLGIRRDAVYQRLARARRRLHRLLAGGEVSDR